MGLGVPDLAATLLLEVGVKLDIKGADCSYGCLPHVDTTISSFNCPYSRKAARTINYYQLGATLGWLHRRGDIMPQQWHFHDTILPSTRPDDWTWSSEDIVPAVTPDWKLSLEVIAEAEPARAALLKAAALPPLEVYRRNYYRKRGAPQVSFDPMASCADVWLCTLIITIALVYSRDGVSCNSNGESKSFASHNIMIALVDDEYSAIIITVLLTVTVCT